MTTQLMRVFALVHRPDSHWLTTIPGTSRRFICELNPGNLVFTFPRSDEADHGRVCSRTALVISTTIHEADDHIKLILMRSDGMVGYNIYHQRAWAIVLPHETGKFS
jgi:hypothetical protein